MKIIRDFLLILATAICCSCVVSAGFSHRQSVNPLNFILGNENLGPINDGGILGEAQAPGPAFNDEPKVPLKLAGNRTKRPDILRNFRIYQGGWDISNKHYWASVAFTGIAGFIVMLVWLISFGIMLLFHHCVGWRMSFKGKGSSFSQKIRIVLLVLFSFASIVGCILLSAGQLELHSEVFITLKYVVNQSDYTAEMLRNVSDYLSLAKSVVVPEFELPQSTLQEIDELSTRLSSTADTLNEKTDENSVKLRKVFNTVRSVLITVASVMLVLAFFGLVLSLLGLQNVIHIFIFSGWLLVAVTLTLCGTFMIFNSAVSDSCMAMKEWVDNPRAETALSNILPCVDERATNQTLVESRKVVKTVVDTVNTFIYTAANTNRPPSDQFYYNQSGPLLPPLCYPFDDKNNDRDCLPQEVSMTNASTVWAKYICMTSMDNKNCTSVGRLTPAVYGQLVVAVNASYAVLHYTPGMLDLQNCNFLRDIFMTITSRYCPPLEHYLVTVVVGLGFISTGIMLCLILWFVYANRPQREEAFVKTPSINKDAHVTMVSLVTSPARVVPDIEK
ncbi:Unconventional myosin-XVIIIa [Bienertia sinuspersici]